MNLNIRNFPDALHVSLTKKAAAEEREIRDIAIEAFENCLNNVSHGMVDDSFVVTCPMCGRDGPAVRFGSNLRCFHCGSGFLVPEGA